MGMSVVENVRLRHWHTMTVDITKDLICGIMHRLEFYVLFLSFSFAGFVSKQWHFVDIINKTLLK